MNKYKIVSLIAVGFFVYFSFTFRTIEQGTWFLKGAVPIMVLCLAVLWDIQNAIKEYEQMEKE